MVRPAHRYLCIKNLKIKMNQYDAGRNQQYQKVIITVLAFR